ncbi:MAG TPA: OsmC family protein, partial [Candidatus Thermoplasmatota archaeon]|nr:OsmC family protein [Candidatus Thermoplasmatota archaeon]
SSGGSMDVEAGTAVPRSAVSVAVVLRGHTLVQDKPQASGGKDEGPMASELLLAGLLACQHSTFVKVAGKRKVEATVRDIKGEMSFADGDIASVRVKFHLAAPAATTDQALGTVLKLTDRTCTISRALKVPIETTYSRSTADAPAAKASPT